MNFRIFEVLGYNNKVKPTTKIVFILLSKILVAKEYTVKLGYNVIKGTQKIVSL
jgi:hypothetical protein